MSAGRAVKRLRQATLSFVPAKQTGLVLFVFCKVTLLQSGRWGVREFCTT
jgi:hypothetical protein